jgi:alcohol dehydrogenase class IV
VLSAVDRFVMGHVSSELTSLDADRILHAYRDQLLANGEFEELPKAVAAGALYAGMADPVFERGLGWLLDGIEADVVK